MRNLRTCRELHADQRGAVTVEWALLIAAFGIPMVWLVRDMLIRLADHYEMMTFMLTLPLP